MGCCLTLSGFARDCDSNIGGIRRAWIAVYDRVIGDVTKIEDKIEIKIDEEFEAEWKEFEFRKQTGSVTSTITKDDATGTLYYENAITLQFTRQETKKSMEMCLLAVDDLAVVIEDNNGKLWFFGYDFSVTLTEGSAESGTAFGDFNGYSVTLTDLSKELPYELTDDSAERMKMIKA